MSRCHPIRRNRTGPDGLSGAADTPDGRGKPPVSMWSTHEE
ncbi:hypothetical protein I545_4918 [Mycobacterium kansasii 662]|uniref:Uncharacterized protein n=1 Tax=Mycobacterium kansasii 662 TaxID=1299326 RepID=X7Z313_MYCKA|nr:hypothetical protein I545_4918 [Mycobacterium kansasii 662]